MKNPYLRLGIPMVLIVIYISIYFLTSEGKSLISSFEHIQSELKAVKTTGRSIFVVIESSKVMETTDRFIHIPNSNLIKDPVTGEFKHTDLIAGICWFVSSMHTILSTRIFSSILIDIRRYSDMLIERKQPEDPFISQFLEYLSIYFNNDFFSIAEKYIEKTNNLLMTIDEGYKKLQTNLRGSDSCIFLVAFLLKLEQYLSPSTSDYLISFIRVQEIDSKYTAIRSLSKGVNGNIEYTILKTSAPLFHYELEVIPDPAASNGKSLADFLRKIVLEVMENKKIIKLGSFIIIEIKFDAKLLESQKKLFRDNLDLSLFGDIEIKLPRSDLKVNYILRSYNVREPGHIFNCAKNKEGKFLRTDIEKTEAELTTKECKKEDFEKMNGLMLVLER